MPGRPWAELTLEEQNLRKEAMAEGRRKKKLANAEAKLRAKEAAAAAKAAAPENSVEVKSIEVPGVLMDASGHTWTIPADSLDDDPRLYKSIFRIPNPDPILDYQFERQKDVSGMILQGFEPVTLKEQGLKTSHVATEYGTVQDGLFRIDDMICLKIPKVMMERRRRKAKAMVDETLSQVGMLPERAGSSSKVEVVRGDQTAGSIKVKRPSVSQSQGA